MAVNVKDVAKKCGLTVQVVDRIMQNCADVGEEGIARAIEAAKALGYPIQDRHRGSHSRNLGVLFVDESTSGLTHPFFAAMLNAFKAEVEARGYDLTFINHNIGSGGETYLEHCRNRNVDGVCLACVDFYSKEVEALLDSEIPCVTIDHPWPGQPGVLSDNEHGLRLLVDTAVSMGHRRIAFIHGQMNSEVTSTRVKNYIAAMNAHNLPVPEGYLVEGRYDDTRVVRALVDRLLERPDRPSCILLPDDAGYFGAQEAIREHELRIPADISVAGYDGIRLTQSLRPQLTTIRQDSEAMGREAAIRLIAHLEHPDEPVEDVTIPVTLIQGSTISWCNQW